MTKTGYRRRFLTGSPASPVFILVFQTTSLVTIQDDFHEVDRFVKKIAMYSNGCQKQIEVSESESEVGFLSLTLIGEDLDQSETSFFNLRLFVALIKLRYGLSRSELESFIRAFIGGEHGQLETRFLF
jgi:hypothetical protein